MKFVWIIGILATITGCCAEGVCEADDEKPYSYHGEKNSPKYWPKLFPTCGGQQQSPINLIANDLKTNDTLQRLDMVNYDQPLSKATVDNNGHTIQVTPTDGVKRTIEIYGSTYTLVQFNFHFAGLHSLGAEHSINHNRAPMEGHFVHKNADGQFAVVGVFIQKEDPNSKSPSRAGGLAPIAEVLSEVRFSEMSTELKTQIDLTRFFPKIPIRYIRYMGSLTSPPCTEGVIWTLSTSPAFTNDDQLTKFGKVFTVTKEEKNKNCEMAGNFRPVQKTNGRSVYISD